MVYHISAEWGKRNNQNEAEPWAFPKLSQFGQMLGDSINGVFARGHRKTKTLDGCRELVSVNEDYKRCRIAMLRKGRHVIGVNMKDGECHDPACDGMISCKEAAFPKGSDRFDEVLFISMRGFELKCMNH